METEREDEETNAGTLSRSFERLSPFPYDHLFKPMSSAEEIYVISSKSGWLYKRGKIFTAWKRRWFIISGQRLLYYKTDKDRRPKGEIWPLRMYKVLNDMDDTIAKQFQFQLVPKNPQGRVYYIYATTYQEKEDWIELLRSISHGGNKSKRVVEIEERLRHGSYEISPEDLHLDDTTATLGKGASGAVKKALWLNSTEVAVKSLNNIPEFIEEEEMDDFYTEIATLSQLRHPNIVSMYGYCKKDYYLLLVTEYMPGGDLSTCIYNPDLPLNDLLLLEFCSSICKGMLYLHSKNVIHRDLKSRNILVENIMDARLKVCDFGLSTITKQKGSKTQKRKEVFGSPAYAAPELSNPNHTDKVDVFSFGITMWEIMSRKRPWQDSGLTHAHQITDAVAAGKRPAIPADHPAKYLIEMCWHQEHKHRPDFNFVFTELEKVKSTMSSMIHEENERNNGED